MGMGRACVLLFHKHGIHTVFCDFNTAEAEKVISEVSAQSQPGGAECHFVKADVTVEEDIEKVVQEAITRFGRIDYLVNNVGGHPPLRTIDSFSRNEFVDLLNLNVVSAFLFSKFCLPHLRKVKGSIVTVSSVVSLFGQPGGVTYVTSKAALNGLTMALAIDEGPAGVRVNAVAPGTTDTPLFRSMFHDIAKEMGVDVEVLYKLQKGENVMHKLAHPDEIASVILFLARDASHITGQIIEAASLGKVALITGGSKGIGRACVLRFHREGIHTVFCDIDATEAAKVVHEALKENSTFTCHFEQADVTREEDVERVVHETVHRLGRIDYLVCLVGWHPPHKPIDLFTKKECDDLMQLNFVSAFMFSQKCLPHLRKVQGSIVHMSSDVSLHGQHGAVTYAATKGAINGMTKALAVDESEFGVRVNAVSPGPTDTPLLREAIKGIAESKGIPEEEIFEGCKRESVLNKVATPEEIAAVVLFLARDATHVTGVIMESNGGTTLNTRPTNK